MKTTEEMMNEIKTSQDVKKYIEENEDSFVEISLSGFLQRMQKKYDAKKSELFRRAGLVGSNYGYELFQNDKKTPSRDVLLSLCMAFPLTIEETQQALRCSRLAALYPREKRDAYLLFCIKNGLSVDAVNDLLVENRLKPLT